jgi:D-galactarolactone isomerase
MLLHGLDALGGLGRGVVVLDANSAKPEMLASWHKRGVRGLRINLYSPVGRPHSLAQAVTDMAAIARDMKWHVELIAPLPMLLEHADLVANAPVPVVIDHYGVYGELSPASAEGKRLLDLLKAQHVWIKLSAPYRVSNNPLETRPNAAWLAAILAAVKARCVWGSDWPHTPAYESTEGAYRPIDYAMLVDDFLAALKPPDLADAIMLDNPARLYGFPDSR